MPRRGKKEPLWPFFLVVAVVIGGLGIAGVMPNELDVGASTPEGAGVGADSRIPSPEDRTRVEVLNGSGVAGVAAEATEVLRASGLDVVYFGNEGSFGRDSSVVLDRTGRAGAAEAVSAALGIHIVRAEPDTTRLVDLTVLIGSDWGGLVLAGVPADPSTVEVVDAPERAWWDPRRFFEGDI